MYSIHTYGDTCLSRKSLPVNKIDEEIVALGQTLIDAMYEDDGIGLAAPQIGINLRMFSLGIPMPKSEGVSIARSPGELQLLPQMPLVLINPEIVATSSVSECCEEGCLSVPDIFAQVERPISVTLKAQVLGGVVITLDCGGLLGRAIQHELDHLDGTLFIDRLLEDELNKINSELVALKKRGQKKGFIKRIGG